MKKIVLLSVLIMFFTVGCVSIEQEIDLSSGSPQGRVTTRLEVQKGMVDSELELFLNSLALSIPSMDEDAEFRRLERTKDFMPYVIYEWEGIQPINGDWSLDHQEDGSYEFRYKIPKVEAISDYADESQSIMVVKVQLPREVDFANTMDTEGNTVIWRLNKGDLLKGVTLRAITK